MKVYVHPDILLMKYTLLKREREREREKTIIIFYVRLLLTIREIIKIEL